VWWLYIINWRQHTVHMTQGMVPPHTHHTSPHILHITHTTHTTHHTVHITRTHHTVHITSRHFFVSCCQTMLLHAKRWYIILHRAYNKFRKRKLVLLNRLAEKQLSHVPLSSASGCTKNLSRSALLAGHTPLSQSLLPPNHLRPELLYQVCAHHTTHNTIHTTQHFVTQHFVTCLPWNVVL
jgi:hypothetical protein